VVSVRKAALPAAFPCSDIYPIIHNSALFGTQCRPTIRCVCKQPSPSPCPCLGPPRRPLGDFGQPAIGAKYGKVRDARGGRATGTASRLHMRFVDGIAVALACTVVVGSTAVMCCVSAVTVKNFKQFQSIRARIFPDYEGPYRICPQRSSLETPVITRNRTTPESQGTCADVRARCACACGNCACACDAAGAAIRAH
jgi:hypothetical protein